MYLLAKDLVSTDPISANLGKKNPDHFHGTLLLMMWLGNWRQVTWYRNRAWSKKTVVGVPSCRSVCAFMHLSNFTGNNFNTSSISTRWDNRILTGYQITIPSATEALNSLPNYKVRGAASPCYHYLTWMCNILYSGKKKASQLSFINRYKRISQHCSFYLVSVFWWKRILTLDCSIYFFYNLSRTLSTWVD